MSSVTGVWLRADARVLEYSAVVGGVDPDESKDSDAERRVGRAKVGE